MRSLLRAGQFHSRYVATDYGRLHYFDSRPGATTAAVIMLHGLGSSSLSLMPLAYFLRQHRRVIVPDLMHFAGFSEPSRPCLTTGEHVDTIDQLARALCLDQVDICGHSLGGGAAIHLAARQPRLVRSLSLINPGGFSFDFDRIKDRIIARPCGAARLRRSVMAYLLSIGEHDFVDGKICCIVCPTLLLWGQRDQVLPADIPRFIASELVHAEIHELPRAGHLAVLEAPHTIARRLRHFWSRHEAPPPSPPV